jgi:hypothetical protein
VDATVTQTRTYVAQWTPKTNTTYKVQHYLEQPNGSYVLQDTDNLTGTTGTTVSATPKTTYIGYTLDTSVAGTAQTGTVAGDGTLTLKLYYKANTNTVYKVQHYLQQNDGTYTLTDTEALVGSTGSTVTGTPKTYVGYTFDSTVAGTIASGTIKGDGTLTLKLYYKANTNTAYKVEHYLEQLDGTDLLKDTENVTGTTGATVTATEKTYIGYTTATTNVLTGVVKGDGSLVIKVYYKLTRHTVTYTAGTYGVFDDEVYTNIAYGSVTPSYSTTPTGQAGYEFDAWSPVVAKTVTSNVIYEAHWKASTNTPYQVQYYLQQSDGTYALKETETLYGTTDTEVEAIIKDYIGYKFNSTIAGTILKGIVKGDGSLVLKVYYNKTKQDITIDPSTYPEDKTGARVSTGDTSDIAIWVASMIGVTSVLIALRRKKEEVK